MSLRETLEPAYVKEVRRAMQVSSEAVHRSIIVVFRDDSSKLNLTSSEIEHELILRLLNLEARRDISSAVVWSLMGVETTTSS